MKILKTYVAPNGSEFVLEYNPNRKYYPYMTKRTNGQVIHKAKSFNEAKKQFIDLIYMCEIFD